MSTHTYEYGTNHKPLTAAEYHAETIRIEAEIKAQIEWLRASERLNRLNDSAEARKSRNAEAEKYRRRARQIWPESHETCRRRLQAAAREAAGHGQPLEIAA